MILLDGQACDSPLLLDRGLAYGDGLFETIAVRDGQPLAWPAHMARLARGCAALSLPAPQPAALLDDAQRLLSACDHGVIKILLTRGNGGRGYRPPAAPQPRRVVSLHPWPAELDEGNGAPRQVWVCRQRLGHQPQLAGIKHLNRLEQVLASAEWPSPDFFEGLMLDIDGKLIEGIRSNVFVVQGKTLLTPELSRCGIAGIVREAVLDCASAHGFVPRVEPMTLAQIGAHDEMFLCNSVMGLRVVGEIAHHDGVIRLENHGAAGEIAASLRVAKVIP